ncbi:prolyl oligopeptidase family serine peptidase [Streptomyces sp. NBC_00385]|uniref:prolyl oligopeptidase family serine peptidase n=1 Tax=Streptomyces sp. NBC_00385 TaxID=2975733 RepID=UPI002DDC2AAF|nr:prolyl oligopeptidase family serine peptidase [Streptomyces sp. NBC_00385]WRZ08470.1 prolyl oligopeptidase family serine peptidase [Streptomyces sp. NBC_00385]
MTVSPPRDAGPTPARPAYPAAPRSGPVELVHGQPVADPYRWLEDPEDPATVAWSAAQDLLHARELARWPGREALREQMAALLAGGGSGPPVVRGGRAFHLRREPGHELAVLAVRENGRTRVLLDPLEADPSGTTVLDAWEPSGEGDLVAVQLSCGGTENSVLRVLDTRTGEVVDGPVDRVRRSPVAWLPGGRAFYYVRRLPPREPGGAGRHRRVYLHEVGTPDGRDTEIFGAGRPETQYYTVATSPDGRLLVIGASEGTAPRTDLWTADLTVTGADRPALHRFQHGTDAHTAVRLRPGRGPLLLRTTAGAPRGRIAAAPRDATDPGRWRTLVGEQPGTVLQDFAVLDGPALDRPLLLVLRTRHAVGEMTLHDARTGALTGTVTLPGTGSVSRLTTRHEPGHEAWFAYTDHLTPNVVLHYDAVTGRLRPWPDDAPAGWQAGGVTVTQEVVRSPDGTDVRMFVMSPTGRPDRPRPTVLTGYGGFGASMTPGFTPQALPWVRAGGVYAVACVRGGGEEGEEWHRAGRREHKHNTFDDFDAAADHLLHAGWAAPGRLGVLGSSNGGLLAGTALTRRPQAYAAVVCAAPLLDMVRYELSGMGASWRDEYGSAEDPDAFARLLAYSPYHRVREGARYPAVLLAVFDGDTRVDPAHARKMCAALQWAGTGDGPVVLRTERGVGHGTRGASRSAGLYADVMAFFARYLGLDLTGDVPV